MKNQHFFFFSPPNREAYALTFGLKPGEKRKLEDATSDVIMVMRTTLSKREFAQALGMKEGDLFVQKMFNIVDKDGDDRISFQVWNIFMIVLWEFGFEKSFSDFSSFCLPLRTKGVLWKLLQE